MVTIDELRTQGFVPTVYPANWDDVGGPENGPMLVGNDGFTEWLKGDQFYIEVEGRIVESGKNPPDPYES